MKKQGNHYFDENQNDDNPFQTVAFPNIQNISKKGQVIFDDL
jgi:hypothetical protein